MTNPKFWNNWTIATRIGAVISVGVVTSVAIIIIGAATYLKKDHIATFGRQQFTSLQAFAMYLDADLTSKLKVIKNVADIIPPQVLLDPSSAQQFLTNRTGLSTLFDDGLMIVSTQGRLLAEIPVISSERKDIDYSAAPFFQQAKAAARPVISEPFYSVKPDHKPIVEMIAPIQDTQGNVAGYLCGGITLNGDNALGNIARRQMGDKGYFYVFSQDRTILIHHDASRMLQKDVPIGSNRLFDLALQGFNGSGETINSKGQALLASFQHLQAAPWILAGNLPKQEVLTPFYENQRLVILTIIICGAAVILFSWISLLRFLAPIERFITHMKECGDNASPFQHTGGPELTLLATIFNQMLDKMNDTQAELAANEELQRTLLNASPDIISFKDGEGRWLLANKADLALFHLEDVDYKGKKSSELAGYSPFYQDTIMAREISDEQAWNHGSMLTTEEIIHTPDQGDKVLEVITAPLFHPDGRRKALVIIGRDITARKNNEDKLHKLSMAVEQSPVTIVIFDTRGNIEFVNPEFTYQTGYTLDEAMGHTPQSLLKTEETPPGIITELWQAIGAGKIWEGDFYNTKKNGEKFIEHVIISPIRNDRGKITQYMSINEDITARKQSDEIIWRQANFDHLTNLPNRRLFLYRLQKSILYTSREGSSLVLMFLDLDRFKEVNDTLGHDYGDILLIEAARRIVECVRDTDTVSRFGGDEFVLMLTRINVNAGIEKISKKILTALSKPFYLENETASVTASIGSTICPQDGTDISTLLKNADRAMYLAKGSGRNCWRSFTDLP
ncbi:MAG: PAS domain S-box/diguanylate cyclase (GGDEF) domain-containing [Desulfobulbaceae bacterium]|nr:MAG: PAS domain S-box/diguanylate cyclase (GGDEF) domain-containing [Desulfobulbaceae bacterium]